MTDQQPYTDEVPDIGMQHFQSLHSFLETHLLKEQAGVSAQRQSARDKLTKLLPTQFQELSTDVFDEMNRRIQDADNVPFLPVQNTFHPKRNQARQKLATLSSNRFKDLASDVYHEWRRRYPQIEDNMQKRQHTTTQSQLPAQPALPPPPMSTPRDVTLKRPLAPPPPVEPSDMSNLVNFSNLDNLMADLGTLIVAPPEVTPPVQSVERVVPAPEPVQQEPVAKQRQPMSSFRTTPGASERSLQSVGDVSEDRGQVDRLRGEKARLQTELDRTTAEQQRVAGELTLMRSEYDSVNADRQRLSDENAQMRRRLESIEQQHRNTVKQLESDLQGEVSGLQDKLEEMERERDGERERNTQLSHEHQKLYEECEEVKNQLEQSREENRLLMQERDAQADKLESFQKEIDRLRDDLANVATRSVQATPMKAHGDFAAVSMANRLDLNRADLFAMEPNRGYIQLSDIVVFKSAVSELLKAASADAPAGVLVAMKSIVIATRNISDAVEVFETHTTPERAEHSADLREVLSQHLTSLMTSAKNKATGAQPSSTDELQAAAEALVSTMSSMVQLVKIVTPRSVEPGSRKGSIRDLNHQSSAATAAAAASGSRSMAVSPANAELDVKRSASVPDFSPAELKLFLEQQTDLIVQNIQKLLQAMRQASFDHTFIETVNGITSVVSNLINVSGATLNKNTIPADQKGRGVQVLKQLSDSSSRLDELGSQLTAPSLAAGVQRPSKQKIAAAAYEVAKHTKELVGLFDMGL